MKLKDRFCWEVSNMHQMQSLWKISCKLSEIVPITLIIAGNMVGINSPYDTDQLFLVPIQGLHRKADFFLLLMAKYTLKMNIIATVAFSMLGWVRHQLLFKVYHKWYLSDDHFFEYSIGWPFSTHCMVFWIKSGSW